MQKRNRPDRQQDTMPVKQQNSDCKEDKKNKKEE